jgi:diguanylate cyclase (GGDEF)-like protein
MGRETQCVLLEGPRRDREHSNEARTRGNCAEHGGVRRPASFARGRHWKQEARANKHAFVAVIMVDVDAYKNYNDHYGHQYGDDCLRVIAQAIASSVTRSGDLVARYSGEEFGVILRDTDQQGALLVAERIRERVENLRIAHAACNNGVVTISLGVAVQQNSESQDPAILVAAADRALYAAKRQGRNRTCVADLDTLVGDTYLPEVLVGTSRIDERD